MTSDNVVDLPVVTRLNIPVDRILTKAMECGLETAVVIGYDESGDFYFSSSEPDGAEVLWLLEYAKKRLFEASDDYAAGE